MAPLAKDATLKQIAAEGNEEMKDEEANDDANTISDKLDTLGLGQGDHIEEEQINTSSLSRKRDVKS